MSATEDISTLQWAELMFDPTRPYLAIGFCPGEAEPTLVANTAHVEQLRAFAHQILAEERLDVDSRH